MDAPECGEQRFEVALGSDTEDPNVILELSLTYFFSSDLCILAIVGTGSTSNFQSSFSYYLY